MGRYNNYVRYIFNHKLIISSMPYFNYCHIIKHNKFLNSAASHPICSSLDQSSPQLTFHSLYQSLIRCVTRFATMKPAWIYNIISFTLCHYYAFYFSFQVYLPTISVSLSISQCASVPLFYSVIFCFITQIFFFIYYSIFMS